MKKLLQFKNIFAMLAGLMFSIILVCLFISINNYSLAGTVSMEGNAGVIMYVNGEYVEFDKSTNSYKVTQDCEVTITIINDNKIANNEEGKPIMTIKQNGRNLATSQQQIYTFNAEVGNAYTVSVNSSAIQKDQKGLSLSDPLVISNYQELETLDAILRDKTLTALQKTYHEKTFLYKDKDFLRTAYYRLDDNFIFVGDEDYSYYGLVDFSGVFDFNNFTLTVKIENNNPTFTSETNVGIFANLLSDTVDGKIYPCVIRNGLVRGSLSLIAPNAGSNNNTLNIGGIAGKAANNIIVDNVTSSMSVTAETSTNINIGDYFGYSEYSLNDQNKLKYDGIYTSSKAITNGANANVNSGALFGVLRNSYINSLDIQMSNVNVIGISTNTSSGTINSGGLIGLYEHATGSSYDELNIKNIKINATDAIEVSAEINNSANNSEESKESNAGGVIGKVNADKDIYFYDVSFITSDILQPAELYVSSINRANSKGDVYAGGLIGQLPASNCYYGMTGDTTLNIFDCDLDVQAIQNGYSEAYASAMFGYNSLVKDNNYNLKINLNNENRSLNVLAQQSSLSRNLYTSNEDSSLRKVAAGYVSSYLQSNFNLNNFELTLNNGKVTAERAVGSTIYGPLYAGGFAGYASCSSSSNNYTFANIKMNYNNSSIYGLSSSFDSNKNGDNMYYKEEGRNKSGNASNTCVGGFIGYMVNYGTITTNNSRGSFSGTSKPGIDDLTITFNNTETNDGVIGVHNAFSTSTSDYVVQGYVGGVVGLVNNGTFRNLNVNSTSNKTKIYLEASSNPNTANCGGLIGTNFKGANFYLINGSVNNLDVTLNAYSSLTNDQYYFDAFCGGVIGSLSKDGGSLNPEVSNVIVKDTDVNCIGEDAMYTFAGGVVGGMWWGSAQYITNCSYINGNVHASSMSGMSYAGGIAGQGGPNATISSSYVVNSNVYCFNGSNKQSGAGGIVGYTRHSNGAVTYANNYSNAYVFAEGSNSSIGGIYANGGAGNNSDINYFDPFNIHGFENEDEYTYSDNAYTTSGNSGYYPGMGGGNNNQSKIIAIALAIRSGNSNDSEHYNYYEVTSTNTAINVYPKYTFSDSSVLKIDYSGDTDCITTVYNNTFNAVNNKIGIVYANLYITIAGQKYLFMSYPIYIDTRNNNNSYNSYSYNSSITNNPEDYKYSMLSNSEIIYYRKVNVTSNPETIEIGLAYDKSFPEYVLYSATEGTDGPTLVENKEKVYINAFNNKLDIEVTDKLISVTPYNDLEKRTVFIMALPNTYGQSSTKYTYLVLDYIPNYVTSLDVRLSEDTPSLGEDSGSYIFSRNDTINLDTYEIYADSTSTSSNYITYSAVDGLPTGVELKPNGTITIDNDPTFDQKFTINATYGGNRYNGSGKLTGTISLIIKQSFTYYTELTGSTFESHRKVVDGTPFDFVISPMIGYGLDPNRVIVEIGTNTYTLQDLTVSSKITTLNDAVNENLSGTITIDGAAFEYVYDPLKDSYSFVIPGGIVDNNIKIIVEYSLVSSIVIDRGIIYEVAGHERYYIYTVKDGTKLTNELFAPIKDEISLSRYGYDFQSYYLTDNGTSVDSYGMTLGDLIKQGNYYMHGPLYLYARWTYQVIVEYPDEVTVESTLPLTMLEKVDVDGAVHLIPINTTTPFTFKINTNEAFEGTPDFIVYTIDRKLVNGEYQYIHTEITKHCHKNSSGAYEIDPYQINGIIYIKVFNESIGFNDGETEIDSSLDTSIINDSIFTINYSVNYSSEGIILEHTVAGHKGISIDFYNANDSTANILPAGTIIRLYRHINGKAYDSYYYVLQYDTSLLELDRFVNMATGNTFANTNVTTSAIRTEKYYLVVTLPNHTTTYKTLSNNIIRFNVTYDESHVNITKYGIDPGDEPPLPSGFIITRTYDVLPSIPVKVTRNNNTLTLDLGATYYTEVTQSNSLSFEGKTYYWKVDSTNTLTDAQLSLFDTYFENRLMLTNGDKTAYYTASKTLFEGDLPDGITLTLLQSENDLRHQSKSYVWEVTASKDVNSIVSTADGIFKESNKILTTLNSVYYLSKNGNYNVDALISEGYTVRLLEVLNTHSPASGIVVFTTNN